MVRCVADAYEGEHGSFWSVRFGCKICRREQEGVGYAVLSSDCPVAESGLVQSQHNHFLFGPSLGPDSDSPPHPNSLNPHSP